MISRFFPFRTLAPSSDPILLKTAIGKWAIPSQVDIGEGIKKNLDEFAEESQTLALLVLKNDRLILERYYNGHSRQDLSMSFSMAKSFLSILIGCALADGSIQSLDQPVTDYLPELTDAGFDKVTIKHLLQMTSGMNYKENDNPFGKHPRLVLYGKPRKGVAQATGQR